MVGNSCQLRSSGWQVRFASRWVQGLPKVSNPDACHVPDADPSVQGLPDAYGLTWATAAYAIVLGLMGLSISWAAPACNNPIFAEIVPAHMRNMVYGAHLPKDARRAPSK